MTNTAEPDVGLEVDGDEWYAAFDGKDTLAFVLAVLGGLGVLIGSLLDWGPEGFAFRNWFYETTAATLVAAIIFILLLVVAYMTIESWVAWVAAALAAVVVGIAVTDLIDIYRFDGVGVSPKFGLWLVLVDGIFAFACAIWMAVGLLDRLID